MVRAELRDAGIPAGVAVRVLEHVAGRPEVAVDLAAYSGLNAASLRPMARGLSNRLAHNRLAGRFST